MHTKCHTKFMRKHRKAAPLSGFFHKWCRLAGYVIHYYAVLNRAFMASFRNIHEVINLSIFIKYHDFLQKCPSKCS